MKIACVIHSLFGGGAERVMAGLVSRLASRGHSVTLITLDDGSSDRYAVDSQVARVCLNVVGPPRWLPGRIVDSRRRTGALRAALRETDPDVGLSFCDRTNVLALMSAQSTNIPMVVSERSDPEQQTLGWYWEPMRRRFYRRAAGVVALTPSAAVYLAEQMDHEVIVIPSAIDRPPQRSDRSVAVANRLVVAVGRLEPEKGFDRLLSAWRELIRGDRDQMNGWRLRVIGEGSQRSALENQITQCDLSDGVMLPGWVRPLWEELAAATLFVLPSRYEGFPSALGEAMAVGVPAIAVDCPSGPRSMIDSEVNGLLVANSTDGLVGGMRRMIDDPQSRENWARAGVRIADQFSWDRMVDAYERVLQDAAVSSNRS